VQRGMGGEARERTQQWVQLSGESEFHYPNSPSPDNGSAQHSTAPSSVSVSQLSWPSSLDSTGPVDSSANQDLLEFTRRLQRELEEKSRMFEEKSRKCNLLEAAVRAEEVKAAMAYAEAAKVKASAEALQETVQALQVRNPEAHTLWRSQANTSRVQARVNERRRKRNEALRKRLFRKERSEAGRVVKGYTRILQSKMASLCEPGGKLLLCMDSNAGGGEKAASAGRPDGEQACKKRTWSTHKVAGRKVLLSMPSSFKNRTGVDGEYVGGIEANPRRLIGTVLNWMQHNLSVRAACRVMAFELAQVQEEVYVLAERHRGQTLSTRKSFPGDSGNKPLDVIGEYCETTLTESIHAFNMTVDLSVSKRILDAHGIHLAPDISTFTTYHMQSLYIFAFRIEEIEKDAACNPVYAWRYIEGFGPAIAVGEKLTRQLCDEDGNPFATSTPRAAALSLSLANLEEIVNHPCSSLGVDGGGEAAGSDDLSSMGNSRANLNGRGSYRHELFVTRQAFGDADAKHGEFLNKLMDFNDVPAERRIKPRPQPKTLVPVTNFTSCQGELYLRTRAPDYTKDRPKWTDAEPQKEIIASRPSQGADPLVCMAMVEGGVATVLRCMKHLAHTLALHACKLVMPSARELASELLAINNVWIFTRLKTVIGKVFALPGCGAISKMQAETAKRLQELDPGLYAEVQARYRDIGQFAKVFEACTTRWGALGEGSVDLTARMPEFAVGMVLAFSDGLEENRINSAVSVWTKEGFRHNGLIKMSPKLGLVVFRMNDPAFIFGTNLHAFFHRFVHSVLQTGSSHNKESCTQIMGGVNSLPRRVYAFLTRVMWVMCPIDRVQANDAQCINPCQRRKMARRKMAWKLTQVNFAPGVLHILKNTTSTPWETHFPLQWKAMATNKPQHGILMLNVVASRKPEGGAKSPVEHWYEDSFHPEMEGYLEKLAKLIKTLSQKTFTNQRNVLPKGLIRSICSGPQDSPQQKMAVMIKCLAVMAFQTAKEIVTTLHPVLFDPHMFLGAMGITDRVPVDHRGESSMYHVAVDKSLANAACLYAQMKEIEQGYAPQLADGEKLGNFLHGPLRGLSLDLKVQEELKAFHKADQVVLGPACVETGSYKRAADKKGFRFRPKPFSAFPHLAILVLKASAQPRTNQKVEGGFSLASMAFRCYRRHQGPEMWSETIRKKNVFNYGIGRDALSKEFIQRFADTLVFRRRNRSQIKLCYAPDTTETEAKYLARSREDLPQYVKSGGAYKVTNICDAPEKNKDALKGRDRNGGRKQNKRHQDDAEPDGDRDLIRAPAHRRKLPAPRSLASPSRWTLESLNKERCETLRDMCSVQGLKVVPCSGKSCTKADYVAALLADQDSPHESSDTQHNVPSAESRSEVGDECNSELHCAVEAEQLDPEPIDQAAPEPSAEAALVDESPAVAGTAGSISGLTEEDMQWLRICEESGTDLYSSIEVDPVEFQSFEREMKTNVTDMVPETSGSDLEKAEVNAMALQNDDAFEKVKQQKVGVWKRMYADAFAASSSMKPSTVVSVKRIQRGAPLRILQLGKPLSSVTLQRSDGHQFTVNATGCVFYLLCTPAGLELIKISAIFQPNIGEGNEQSVWVQYCRVLKGSEASQVCDRTENLVRTMANSDGNTFLSSSSGSKQIEMERTEWARNHSEELYHWGDVFPIANTTGLVGGVYWVAKCNEHDRVQDNTFKQDLLKGLKDKFPIQKLGEMDFVVVGSCFSDSKD
jgi:hypothetical protein